MTTSTFKVEGMTCDACRRVISKRLSDINGIADIEVNVPAGSVTTVSSGTFGKEEFQEALRGTHYKVIGTV